MITTFINFQINELVKILSNLFLNSPIIFNLVNELMNIYHILTHKLFYYLIIFKKFILYFKNLLNLMPFNIKYFYLYPSLNIRLFINFKII